MDEITLIIEIAIIAPSATAADMAGPYRIH